MATTDINIHVYDGYPKRSTYISENMADKIKTLMTNLGVST